MGRWRGRSAGVATAGVVVAISWCLATCVAAGCTLSRDGNLVVGGGAGGSGGAGGGLFDCESVDDCTGTDTTCSQRTCASRVCGAHHAPAATECSDDGGVMCDGEGSCVACVGRLGCTAPATCVDGQCVSGPGAPCRAASECQSGLCVDDVCCGTACDAICEACIESLTGVADGTCAPVLAGIQPTGDCASDQQCNGAGSCEGCLHRWSHPYGNGAQPQFVEAIAVDGNGDVIVIGRFEGGIDFGGNPMTSTAANHYDVFVAKLDGDTGNHVWSFHYGDGTQDAFGQAVAVDSMGDVIVSGVFRGTIDFGGNAMVSTALNHYDVFVAKLDGDTGARVWSHHYGDGANDPVVGGVAVDGSNNAVVVGQFQGSIDFGGSPMTAVGQYDIFVAKLAPDDGNRVWSIQASNGLDDQFAEGVAVDKNSNVIVVGRFMGALSFGGTTIDSIGNDYDVYVVKLEPTGGAFVWGRSYGDGTRNQFAEAVAADVNDNVYVTGRFRGSVDFDGIPLVSAGDKYDVFAAKLEPTAGNPQWAHVYGDGVHDQVGRGIAADVAGNTFLTGQFEGSIDFGGGAVASTGSAYDVFTAKLDGLGNQLCGGAHGDGDQDQDGRAVAVDAAGNPFFTGRFRGSIDFGGGPLMSAAPRYDVFVASLGP